MSTQNTNQDDALDFILRELFISDDAIKYILSTDFTDEQKQEVLDTAKDMDNNSGLDYDFTSKKFIVVENVDQIIAEEEEDDNHNLDPVGVAKVDKKLGRNQW